MLQIGSRHSLVGGGDAASIASEDMQALIADMTVRLPEELDGGSAADYRDDGVELGGDEAAGDDGSATETEAGNGIKAKHAAKSVRRSREDGNETGDSGLQLSDSSR